uniref:Uncharacterized protein n=1 Tax=Anguilla anguilla TaxID=7936 RepID=A0A0E9UME5_ANGAN
MRSLKSVHLHALLILLVAPLHSSLFRFYLINKLNCYSFLAKTECAVSLLLPWVSAEQIIIKP